MDLFLVICGALISVMNPLGTVPIFVGLTKEHTTLRKKQDCFLGFFQCFCHIIDLFFCRQIHFNIFWYYS